MQSPVVVFSLAFHCRGKVIAALAMMHEGLESSCDLLSLLPTGFIPRPLLWRRGAIICKTHSQTALMDPLKGAQFKPQHRANLGSLKHDFHIKLSNYTAKLKRACIHNYRSG